MAVGIDENGLMTLLDTFVQLSRENRVLREVNGSLAEQLKEAREQAPNKEDVNGNS